MRPRGASLIVTLVTVLALLPIVAGCSDDDEPDLPDDIDVVQDLPDDWPDDFPVYPGASLESVLTSNEPGAAGTLAAFETEDSVSDVTGFYQGALDQGPWVNALDPQISDSEASFLIQREDGSNPESSIAVGEEDGATSILVFLTADQ